MGTWPAELNTLLTGPKLNLAGLAALYRILFTDTHGAPSMLGWFGFRAAIEAKSTTTINFAATSQLVGLPIVLAHHGGRVAVLTAAPTNLTVSLSAGTHFVYADLAAAGANGISTAVTLVDSTTGPNTETTINRAPLGQYEADGSEITATTAYYPWQDQGAQPRYMAIVASSAPSPAFRGMLWYDTVNSLLKVHNGSTFVTLATSTAAIPTKHLAGLTQSNNTVDPNNDLDIGTGSAADDDDTAVMVLGTAITKRLDAAWAVGTNQGGLDTGAKAADTWYHVWLIQRSDTLVVDVLFSLSSSSPTMPTNYDRKRRIGSWMTDGSSNFLQAQQTGDEWSWEAPTMEVNLTNPGASAVLHTLKVPTGFRVVAKFNIKILNTDGAGVARVYVSRPGASDVAPSTNATPLSSMELPVDSTNAVTRNIAMQMECLTNASGQIRTRFNTSDADDVLRIVTLGWVDRRGR